MNEEEVKKRLLQAIESINEKINSISDNNAMQIRLNRQIKGKTALSYSTIENVLEKVEGLSAEWLLRGKGPMTISQEDKEQPAIAKAAEPRQIYGPTHTVPRISKEIARTQNLDVVKYIEENKNKVDEISLSRKIPEHDYEIEAFTSSMDPIIRVGDTLALKKLPKNGRIIEGEIYMIDTKVGMLMRRLFDGDDHYLCKATSSDYPDMIIDKRDTYNIMRIVAVLRLNVSAGSISFDDLHRKENQIIAIDTERRKLIDENISYGRRIDSLMNLLDRLVDK